MADVDEADYVGEVGYDCGSPECENLAHVVCGCGEDAYHGYCDKHLEHFGWVRPEAGQCWSHPEQWLIARRNRWDAEDPDVRFMLHRLAYVRYGDVPWEVFDLERGCYVKIEKSKNGLPLCRVSWTYPYDEGHPRIIPALREEYIERAQRIEGFECFISESAGVSTTRDDLFEVYPESPDIKSAGKA